MKNYEQGQERKQRKETLLGCSTQEKCKGGKRPLTAASLGNRLGSDLAVDRSFLGGIEASLE